MSVLDLALNTVASAIEDAEAARRNAEQAAAADRANRHRQYFEILIRAKSPKPGDDKRLAELILSLGLATVDVRRDAQRIAKAEADLAVCAQATERYEAWRDAIDAMDQMEARHKAELDEARRKKNHADHEHRRAGWAEDAIAELYRTAPELFADGLLRLPEQIVGRLSTQPKKPKPPRVGAKYEREINGRMHEPLIGDDGQYVRDSRGQYVFAVKPWPEPLLDDQGRPVVDKHGRLVYPESKEPAAPSEAPETADTTADDGD